VAALKQWFAALGVPRRIRSDGSKSLIASEEVREIFVPNRSREITI